jgi:hypothetical protein
MENKQTQQQYGYCVKLKAVHHLLQYYKYDCGGG